MTERPTPSELYAFVSESNRIEGIVRPPTRHEVGATERFLMRQDLSISALESLVRTYQPGARLREAMGMNVRVGDHIAPPGGPEILPACNKILIRIAKNDAHPYVLHREYETLHPFMDGNGRSGRALWAWQMLRFSYEPGIALGFLHCWYYQSLQEHRS